MGEPEELVAPIWMEIRGSLMLCTLTVSML